MDTQCHDYWQVRVPGRADKMAAVPSYSPTTAASELDYRYLRETILSVLAGGNLNLKCDRCFKVQEFGKRLVAKIETDEDNTVTALSECITERLND